MADRVLSRFPCTRSQAEPLGLLPWLDTTQIQAGSKLGLSFLKNSNWRPQQTLQGQGQDTALCALVTAVGDGQIAPPCGAAGTVRWAQHSLEASCGPGRHLEPLRRQLLCQKCLGDRDVTPWGNSLGLQEVGASHPAASRTKQHVVNHRTLRARVRHM